MLDLEPQKHSDSLQLAGGVSIALVGRIGARLFDLVSQVLLARVLGPGIYGLYIIGYGLQRFIGWISSFGLEQAVIHFGASYWGKDESKLRGVILQALSPALLFSTMLSVLLFVASPLAAKHVYGNAELTNVFRWFSLVFPMVVGVRVAAAAIRISLRMQLSVLVEDIIQPVLNLLFILAFLAIGISLWGSIYAYLLSYGIAFISGIYFLYRFFFFPSKQWNSSPITFREMAAFSFPASLSGVFVVWIIWVDRIMVGALMTPATAGVYTSASQIALIFAIIISALTTIFSPLIAALVSAHQSTRVSELYRISTKWAFYIAIPIFSIMLVYAREVMTVLYGEAYLEGASILVILISGQLFNAGSGPVGSMLIMNGFQKEWFRITALFLTIDIILNLSLIPIFGMAGAAIATSLSIIGIYTVGVVQIKRSLKTIAYDRRFAKAVIILIAVLVILNGVHTLIDFDLPLLNLALGIVVAIGSFVALFQLFGWDAEDRDLIQQLIKRNFSV